MAHLDRATQAVCLATLVALPRGHVYIIFSMMIGKLYVNSLLASLNVRASLSRAALADTTVATTTTTTLRFRGGPHTLPSTDSGTHGADTVLDSEQDWEGTRTSERLTGSRMAVSRSSTLGGGGGEVKMREEVEDAAV
ncbi:hypothetical protein TRAPUB_11152 [Trametes pubescens]|uniref:DUF6534 domain-containing protein n=1 Tax=Trametes pubescens TaxID=154538 RepID=A0A1M2VXG1_TRAPU|nr:hypothetical protein TRAPUB_11152 [Trametes pubescens]